MFLVSLPITAVLGALGGRLGYVAIHLLGDLWGPMPVGVPSAPIGELIWGSALVVGWSSLGTIPSVITFALIGWLGHFAAIDIRLRWVRLVAKASCVVATGWGFWLIVHWCASAHHRSTAWCRDCSGHWEELIWPGIAAFAAAIVTQSRFWEDERVQKSAGKPPSFDAVSFKHTPHISNGGRMPYTRPVRKLEYKGLRLSGEVPLSVIFEFAYSPLRGPWKLNWEYYGEYYEIEAIAPAGTNLDGARAMLGTVLAERLGFKYHLTDRFTPIYALLRATGDLNLAPAAEPGPNSGATQIEHFKNGSASLADFADFLSSLMDLEVVDKTGIPGQYQFDVDWSTDIRRTGGFGPRFDPTIVSTRLKMLGLKLKPRKEWQKFVVVDHLNTKLTPN